MIDRPLRTTGYNQFKQTWNSWKTKPDGIICTNDNHTIGLLQVADEIGINVPGDLNIATLADKGVAEPPADRVTRIEYDVQEIVLIMLQRLAERINGETPQPDVLKIEPKLKKEK